MTCITTEGLAQLRTDDRFNSWLQKIKNEYPDKSDADIENTLITFMELNNGNFPGDTPFGTTDTPIKSVTFDDLVQVYDGDEVRAMEVYEHLFSKEFIEEFGNWCDTFIDTEGLTEEQIEKKNQEEQIKLLKAVRNKLGEPALLFVNSVNQQSAHSASAAVTKKDLNLPFKIIIENGEAHAIVGYDRPVQSGSITFIAAKNITTPVSSTEEVQIDVDDVRKAYDFNSENKGFTEKRLSMFLTQSSKDLYYVSKQISKVNGLLKAYADRIHSKDEAVAFIRDKVHDLVFDTDETSPFGHIQLMSTVLKGKSVWQIVSPEGIFSTFNRYKINGKTMTERTQTDVDRLANLFFINIDRFKSIKDYIISNINIAKSDSYLSSPIVDYDGDRFVLKPASSRTQHNVKTELGLTYAVYMFNKNSDKFKKYLNWAKQFSDIRQNSNGVEVIKDVNMVGNLIGSILSGQLIDGNYYTAHAFDRSAIEQAIFVSKHQNAVRSIVEELWKDVQFDIQTVRMQFLNQCIASLSKRYNEIDFSDITDNISKNRSISKLNEYDIVHSFCDTIDKVKAAYGYRRNDSGSKKMYDATEYTKISATYEQLNSLNKDIKEYLINHGGEDTVSGESLEKLISKYFTCINSIVSIMDDDISKLEDFIWHTPEMYTPEYYSSLLYLDRSIIKMYTSSKNKNITEAMFNLDSDESDLIQKALYNIFSQRQVRAFEELRSRYYKNYAKLSNLRTIHDKKGSLESIITTMIEDAISHICDEWCNKNLKCLTEREEREYRENLKLDLEGHINAGMPLDTAIGGASSSGHSIINVLYRIIQTQGKRSNLLIKQKGDALVKQFKSVFNNHNPLNQCKQFCEMIDGKTTGYFIRDVNYGQYYRAKVAEQRRLLNLLPKNDKGQPLYYTINESKSTATKLFIEWGVGTENYQNDFLDNMDRWIEKNANRRYNAQYYINRRRILGQERNGIVVGNEAANRQNILRRQIDGIKNRYVDKETGVFLPSKVPPVQKKILDNLERQLQDLSSPYERYTNSDGTSGIREKTGLDLAIALNIREWNEYIQNRRNYTQDVERYNKVEQNLKSRIGKGITKKDYDDFVSYYHRLQAKQEYYDALEQKYKGGYGEYQEEIDDIRFKRRSILSRVKHGKKGLLQYPNLDELTDAEWEELKRLDVKEQGIKDKLPQQFNSTESITSHIPVQNESTGKAFIDEHKDANKMHGYTDDNGIYHPLSVYFMSVPADFESLTEEILTDQFSSEDSEYMNKEFDHSNSSYEQPRAYEKGSTRKKLYKNDEYDKIKNNEKLFGLYTTFLNMMQEANQMFGYAAISSNYKLPQIYEREASVYIGRGCSVANSFVYKMKRSFLIDERDLDRSYTSDVHADNTTSGKLRKRFVEMLSDPEHISTDLVYSVMAYYMTACRYSDKQDIQAQCELINRKIDTTKDINEGLKTQANNTVETFLFENTMNTNSTVAAVLEKFMEHTTGVMLKWKLKTAVKAFLDGYRLFMNTAVSNKWNMRGHFLEAVFGSVKNTFTSVRSDVDVLDYNLDEALLSLNEMNLQSFADTNKTKFTRAYYKSGMMPTLTAIDHVTTKAIMRAIYSSIRLYTNPDGTKQFLNIDEFVNVYKKDHPDLNSNVAEKEARDLFWGKNGNKVTTLRDAYQLKDNILSIKDDYINMFSSDEKVNKEQWDILQTRVEGQLNMMAASINGFKPEDAKAGNVMRKWYLKPIFQIRSFLIANYNELFKHSSTLKHLVADTSTRNTNEYRPQQPQTSQNSTVNALNKIWSTDNNVIQLINNLTSEPEMYNVLTGTKDIGYYFGVMSMLRKLIENFIIYCGSIAKKEDPEYRRISDLEKTSVINTFLVIGQAAIFYNIAVFVGGLLCCLLGQGSNPDDEDEWFVHWFLWTLYDIAGSMVNETLVNIPTGDTLVDIFKNIMAIVPAMEQFKQSVLNLDDSFTFVQALLGFDDQEVFEDAEYGTDSSPFNLIRSGKWKGEMYGKRRFYETIQNMSPIPLVNLKESFSAHAAKAKASYTFNNLSPMDYFNLGTPSSSDERYNKFHNYGAKSAVAGLLNSLIGGPEGEEEALDFIRSLSTNPYTPIPTESPVDKIERQIPLGREYE